MLCIRTFWIRPILIQNCRIKITLFGYFCLTSKKLFILYSIPSNKVDILSSEAQAICGVIIMLGKENKGFSASIGFGRYDDPYYTNYNAFLNLSKIF